MSAVLPLSTDHAGCAAQLHIAGQPGTFLSGLGPEVLTVLYQVLPQSNHGFGFAAVDETNTLVGFASATTSVGGLFWDLGTRHLGQFLPPLTKRYLRRPALILSTAQTLFYPFMVEDSDSDSALPTAELLSIMVEPERRSQGVGSLLMDELVSTCQRRGMKLLDVTVDAENSSARRFYESHRFALHKSLSLNGREMCQYRRPLQDSARG